MSGVKAVVHRMETVVSVASGDPAGPRESVLAVLENGNVLEGWRRVYDFRGERRSYGGVEIHATTCPDYMDQSDWNVCCTATGQGCWHDGSSLAFDDLGLDGLFERERYELIAALIADRYGADR